MCGRFSNDASPETLARRFGLGASPAVMLSHNQPPSWNIAPSQMIRCITRENTTPKLATMRWGYLPRTGARLLINARSETVMEKPSFRRVVRHQRCLVIATGWYEWAAPRKPYYFYPKDGAPMGFAGIFWHVEAVEGKTDEIKDQQAALPSCVILTTAADAGLAEIHHRCPLVVPPEAYSAWNDPTISTERLQAMLQPPLAADFCFHPVDAAVGSPQQDHAGLISPIENGVSAQQASAKPATSAQLSLFS